MQTLNGFRSSLFGSGLLHELVAATISTARQVSTVHTVLRSTTTGNSSPRHKSLVDQVINAAKQVPALQNINLLDLSIDDAVSVVEQERRKLPKSVHDETGFVARLNGVLLPLLELQRDTMDADFIGPHDVETCSGFDVLISDIKPADLPASVSDALGLRYLSDCLPVQAPVKGVVFGRNKRVMLSMPVTASGRSVRVHFLFETGAPRTYLAASAVEALGVQVWDVGTKIIRINGIKADVDVSDVTTVHIDMGNGSVKEVPCHFRGLNLMGMDFLDRIEGKLVVDAGDNSVSLTSPCWAN